MSSFIKQNISIEIETLRRLIKYFFALITIHVLVVYFIKNLGGFDINSFVYVLIKMWKEVVLVSFVFLYLYANRDKKLSLNVLDVSIFIFLLIGILYVIVAPSKLTAVWSFRSIYEVFGFYVLGRCLYLNSNELTKFFYLLILMGCLTSIFAIIQVQFLGADFFKEVYGVDEVATAMTTYGYESLRASSTFITPHEFGLFIVLCFMFSSFLYKTQKIKKATFLFVNLLFLIGLAFSLSRSSIVVLIICYGLYWVNDIKSTLRFLVLCLVAAIVLYFIGVAENISSVLGGKDPSTMGRFVVFQEFLKHLSEYPLGSGMGTVGVVVRRFIPNAPQFEGEIFNIFAMMGILGGLAYLGTLFIGLIINRKKSKIGSFQNRHFHHMLAIIIIALTLRELILPRDFTNYALGWYLVGLSMSQSKFISEMKFLKLKVSTNN